MKENYLSAKVRVEDGIFSGEGGGFREDTLNGRKMLPQPPHSCVYIIFQQGRHV